MFHFCFSTLQLNRMPRRFVYVFKSSSRDAVVVGGFCLRKSPIFHIKQQWTTTLAPRQMQGRHFIARNADSNTNTKSTTIPATPRQAKRIYLPAEKRSGALGFICDGAFAPDARDRNQALLIAATCCGGAGGWVVWFFLDLTTLARCNTWKNI